MTPQRRAALLWGVIGALTFLVLIQGYELLSDQRIDYLLKVGVALVVGIVSAVATGVLQGRLPADV